MKHGRLIFLILGLSKAAFGACAIQNSNHALTSAHADAFYQMATRLEGCALQVQDLKAQFIQNGASVEPAMVGNRGFNNPVLGSFSFFETVSGHLPAIGFDVAKGELFFGHFTAATTTHQLILDQEPDAGKLMVELIAWDQGKKLFNFYELIGQGTTAQWFYRGDSLDILRDNTYVYRDPPAGQRKFGTTLRCAGCHSSGGPIMKELALPHNDWWTVSRKLPLGPNVPTTETVSWLTQLVDAETFAQNVKNGIHELEASPTYRSAKASLSLQEKLRPLFCENEINLESSLAPSGMNAPVQVPSAFIVNPLLGAVNVILSAGTYAGFVKSHGLRFPETRLTDADHPWLTPVKGYSDLLAIQTLMQLGIADSTFVRTVLLIDADNPVFSKTRCDLLKLLPENGPTWQTEFLNRLRQSPSPAAKQLAQALVTPQGALSFMNQTVNDQDFQKLLAVRQAAFASEISQNPRGQILEPGFRVIFPQPAR